MRGFGCFGILIVIGCLGGGARGLYTSYYNQKPLEMTYEEWRSKRPDAEWLTLKNCQLALPEALYMESRLTDNIKEVFIPVRVPGDDTDKDRKILILVASKNKETIALLQSMKSKSDSQQIEDLVKNLDKLYQTRDVSGLIRSSFGKDKERRQLLAAEKNLDPNFVVLDEGEKPDAGVAGAMLLIGFLVLGGMIFLSRVSITQAQPMIPVAAGPAAPPPSEGGKAMLPARLSDLRPQQPPAPTRGEHGEGILPMPDEEPRK